MPAFGAFAGGLNVRDEAFAPLFQETLDSPQSLIHVLGERKVYAIPAQFCAPD
jgi:metallophosphoesterase superfamily enzyme